MTDKLIVANDLILHVSLRSYAGRPPDARPEYTGAHDCGMDEILGFRTTTIITPGSAEATFTLAVDPDDPWGFDFRANDIIYALGGVSEEPDPADFATSGVQYIWYGRIVNLKIQDDPTQGQMYVVEASTNFREFEITTETDTDARRMTSQGGLSGATLVLWAAQACGLWPDKVKIDTTAPDVRGLPVPLIGYDPNQAVGVNHQYQNWSTILGSGTQFVGRELFADEAGVIQYRLSHFEDAPDFEIPPERIITPIISIDDDEAIANQIRVRWGPQELQAVSGNADAPDSYPFDQYHRRMEIIATPWLYSQSDADWYAKWVLQWMMHNTHPAIVTLAFLPTIMVGHVYTLSWPQRMAYYVQSVVHQYEAGKAPVTVLGMAYGRAPTTTWFDFKQNPAPVGFGNVNYATGAGAPVALTGNQLRGTHWRTSYYTPSDPGQAPLTVHNDDPRGPYLATASGDQEFQSFWTRGKSDSAERTYDTRPCAFDPDYVIPELSGSFQQRAPGSSNVLLPGGVTLSAGDILMLIPTAAGMAPTFVECADTGGGVVGRHLDVFYWDAPNPAPPDYQDVQYVYIQNAGMQPPQFQQSTGNATVPPVDQSLLTLPPLVNGNGGTLAQFAETVAGQLQPDGLGQYIIAPANSGFANWLADPKGGDTSRFNAQCVLFVRYCLLHNGYPAAAFGNAYLATDPGVGLVAQGYVVVHTLPQEGDVLVFDSPQNGGNPGHIAIIIGVTAPQATDTNPAGPDLVGFVTVAQSNCPQTIMTFPLRYTGNAYQVTDNLDKNGVNTFGPNVVAVLRYTGGR